MLETISDVSLERVRGGEGQPSPGGVPPGNYPSPQAPMTTRPGFGFEQLKQYGSGPQVDGPGGGGKISPMQMREREREMLAY